MSLQVWLPLNGDLKNQGLANIEITNHGATINNNGKIGKCYSFNGSNNYLRFKYPMSNLINSWSFCCWVKFNQNKTETLISSRKNTGYGMSIFHIGGQLRFDNGTDNTQSQYTFSPTITLNTWQHIAIIQDQTTRKLYINGILVSTINAMPVISGNTAQYILVGASSPSDSTPTANYLNGYLNDVRIYDHALSVKEVKEIAKGLVLHYPLNCNGIGIPNLVDNSATFSGWTAGSGWTLGETDGIKTYSFSRTGATSNNWVRLIPTLQVNGNDYPNGITVSMDIYTPDKSAINKTCFGSLQTYQSNGSRIGWVEPWWDVSKVINNQWCRISYTFTQAQLLNNNTSGTTYAYTKFSFQLVQNGNISIRKIKIEAGNKATTYTISINDLNDTREFDTSGYQRHGIKTGTTFSIDSARYRLSTVFNVNTDTITPKAVWDTSVTIPQMSVSIWFKTNNMNNTNPNLWSFGENSFARIRLASATSVWYYVKVASTMVGSTYTTNKTLTDNKWHHSVFVFNNGIIIMYLDGEQIGTTNHTSTGASLTMSSTNWHLAGYTDHSESFLGSLSDCRVYATALSAADVKALYTDAGYVDKNGNFHAYEFVEG